jgi:flagellar hook capping protein FlgD
MKPTLRALILEALIATLAIGAPASSRCIYMDVNGDGVSIASDVLTSSHRYPTVYGAALGDGAGILHPAPGLSEMGTTSASVAVNASTAPDDPPGSAPQIAPPPADTPSQTYAANAYLTDENRVVRLYSRGRSWSAELEAVSAFQVADIVPSSITASYGGTQIHAIGARKVAVVGNSAPRLAGIFWKGDLIALFAGAPDGQAVDVLLSGKVGQRGVFMATVSVVVDKDLLTEKDFGGASPNPFNPSTTISFGLAKAGTVKLRIFDVSGRLVSTLADQDMPAGRQEVRWDGIGRNGSHVPSGVYFYVLETPERTIRNALVVAK